MLRMKVGQLLRGSPHPAPVGRLDYYTRELHPSLFIRSAKGLPVRNFLAGSQAPLEPRDVARECHLRYGVYPLNFSFPTSKVTSLNSGMRSHFLSTTYPGEPHSYTQWEDYLEEYRSCFFALSTKKGGWDTFRHGEILFSGAIPLMPRLGRSHRYALAHYPKQFLTSVLDSLLREGPAVPDSSTQEFLHHFALSNLTTHAMARYLIDVSGMATDRVVFFDEVLPRHTDYLSLFTCIGLSEVLAKNLVIAIEPPYLFDDFSGETTHLYGKGFGYTRSIPSIMRSADSVSAGSPWGDVVELAHSASTIVVGNYDANREKVGRLLDSGIPADRFVCVLGSDLPPDRSLLWDIKRSGMTFFVREFPD